MRRLLAGAAAILLAGGVAQAQLVTVFEDDFESYATNADLVAGQWDTNTLSPGLSTAESVSGSQAMGDHGTATQSLVGSIAGLDSAAEPITVSYWLYDSTGDGAYPPPGSATLNGRAGLSFGTAAGNYVFIGAYHTTSPTHYSVRVIEGGNWQATSVPRTVGWHKFTMVLDNGTVNFYHNDGETPVLTDTYTTLDGWGQFIRLASPAGGPYNDAFYDDILIQTGTEATGPDPYIWAGGAEGAWTDAANWSPERTTPDAADLLVFDTSATVTGVPTETVAGLLVTDDAQVILQSAASATVTVDGDVSAFRIDPGARLTLGGTNQLGITIPNEDGGSIAGELVFSPTVAGVAQRITAGVAGAVVVHDGGVTAMAPVGAGGSNGFVGSAEGGIIFEAGSKHVQGGFPDGSYNGGTGTHPYALGTGVQAPVFDPESTYLLVNGFPNLMNRTTGHFVYTGVGSGILSGSTPPNTFASYTLDAPYDANVGTGALGTSNSDPGDHYVITGDFNILGTRFSQSGTPTGPANIRVGGDMTVADRSLLTITNFGGNQENKFLIFDGSAAQTLDANGATVANLVVDNAAGLTLASSVVVQIAATIDDGTITADPGAALLLLDGATGPGAGYTGPLGVADNIDFSTVGAMADLLGPNVEFEITAAGTLTGAGTPSGVLGAWSEAGAASNLPGDVTGINRVWTIQAFGGEGYEGTLTFTYDESDIPVGVDEESLVAARWTGSEWEVLEANSTVDTGATTVTVTGVTEFSDWTLVQPSTSVQDWNQL